MPKQLPPDPSVLARACLDYLAEDPEQLGVFMAASGYSPADLRAAIGTAGLNHGLIDYFAANEPLLLALCANERITPESFMRVWAQLNPAA